MAHLHIQQAERKAHEEQVGGAQLWLFGLGACLRGRCTLEAADSHGLDSRGQLWAAPGNARWRRP